MRPKLIVQVSEWYSEQPKVVKVLVVATGAAIGMTTGIVVAPTIGAFASVVGLGVGGTTLGGAAASSAGLAAIGFGSLASGGYGMAAGTAIVSTASGGMASFSAAILSKRISKNGRVTKHARKKAQLKMTDPMRYTFE